MFVREKHLQKKQQKYEINLFHTDCIGKIMIKYMKKTCLTIIEAILFTILIIYLFKFYWNIRFDNTGTYFLFFFSILLIVLFKLQLKKLRRWRVLHFSLKKVDKMTGIEFENFLLAHFQALGCKAATTKASNDYGADLIIEYKRRRIAIQAKRYHGTIGVKAVQEVIGSMAYYGTDSGLVVTNSHYSKNAQELALANHVVLWDRDVLICMMNHDNMAGYLSELL